MYLHLMSLLHIDTLQVVEILPHVRQIPTYIVNIMAVDALPTQGARASTALIITMLGRINRRSPHIESEG